MNVWYAIPTCNAERATPTLAKWSAMGYKTAALVNDSSPVRADVVFQVTEYPGYFTSVNYMAKWLLLEDKDCHIVVTGGDDIDPDPVKTAAQLGAEFFAHFPTGLGVMQPTGDPMGEGDQGLPRVSERICGSPWFSRAWVERAYQGTGPFWHEYRQFFGDEELLHVTKGPGYLWQRRDVTQFHHHWLRQGEASKTTYQCDNDRYWNADKALYQRRANSSWPFHKPIQSSLVRREK